jgi:ribosome-associated heat shock protein Hsp15
MSATPESTDASARVDVWLWAVRLFKSRNLAAEACRKGQISIAGQRVKPARQVRPGDELAVTKSDLTLTVSVRATLNRRVGAKEVATYLEDRTPEEVRAAAEERRQAVRLGAPFFDDGAGRPTKRDRRDLDEVIAEAEDRQSFYEAMNRAAARGRLAIALFCAFLSWSGIAGAADPPKRSFEPAAGAPTLQISENLSISAEKLTPETDPSTGAMSGMAASGRVIIKAKPKGAAGWVVVSCEKAVYRAEGDEIVLTGWPAVKSGAQILRATGAETIVRVARATGKWEIKGPHRIELSFGK